MTHYAAINQSPRVSAADFSDMCEAVNLGFKAYAQDLGKTLSTCTPVANADAAPENSVLAWLVPDADVPGAGGYHDQSKGRPYIKAFVNIYLDNGGSVIAETEAAFNTSILGAWTHEHFEADDDAPCNFYAAINTTKETARERCDACEDIGWPVKLASGRTVYISDYLQDGWFNAEDTTGPYDKCKKLSKPFSLSPLGGGYMIMQDLKGSATQYTGDGSDDDGFDPSCNVHQLESGLYVVSGPKMPLWKLEHKIANGRIGQRIVRHHKR